MSTLTDLGHRLADDFVRLNPPLSHQWEHEHGVLLRGLADLYEATGRPAYLSFLENSLEPLIAPDGQIKGYELQSYEMDNIVSGRALLSLQRLNGQDKYLRALKLLRSQFDTHPKASFGNFLHKKVFPEILFIDSTYMGLPFLAEYEASYGKGDFEAVFDNFFTAYELNLKPDVGLMAHGYNATRKEAWADPVTGQSRTVWGRGQGWYVVGLIEVLSYVPLDHPQRERAVEILTALLKRLLDFRDSKGLWQQVVDQVDREGNYPEASASAMFTYALAKAVNQGYLPKAYAAEAKAAYSAIVKQFIRPGENG